MKLSQFLLIIFSAITLTSCSFLNKKSKAGLQIITDGVGSTVFLDGQYLEKAPCVNREIKPGKHLIKIQPNDETLVAYETELELHGGSLTVIAWKLAKRPELSGGVIYEMEPLKSRKKAEVSFTTIPDGAIISLANQEKKFAPIILNDIKPGLFKYEVTLPSYETQEHHITIVAGYRLVILVKLAKLDLNPQPTPKKSNQEQTEKVASNSAVATTKQVLITPTHFFKDDHEVLRVRDQASSQGKEIGFALVGKTYPYLQKQNHWFEITFNQQSGWISEQYAKIVEQE